ncbi:conjugal transfer protein TrbE [Steroidobacter denitrificans]|uniref:Conjugal transfer protein TrbE n=1 Tax=Steroidobacter denitrificans TaxID=465721 RepID=A0A127FCK4_STEDE|nr:type IV secretion system DNA-binding domain-containing protein [Steroidobacter denitrificans]AMN47400.1 conjugal transfer protein TrbE [Steroidobacter denitrificans]
MLRAARKTAWRRERMAAERIPFSAHVSEHVLRTSFGDYLQAFRIGGASFESADDEQINAWHERLNVLWRNIASPQVALWTHVIRRRERDTLRGRQAQGAAGTLAAESGFADALSRKYQEYLAGEALMMNELFLAVVYRPAADLASSAAARILSRGQPGESHLALMDALDACGKLARILLASLSRYEPELLGTYMAEGRRCSSLLEYLGLLVNGESQRMPLPTAPLDEVLATSRLLFGAETIEYRTPTRTRFGAMLGIKEYSTPCVAGMYNRLLAAPFPFVLTQSFAFLSKAAAQGVLQRQYLRMANAGDFAVSQAALLQEALDALTSNEFVMGDHHFSLQVLADASAEQTCEQGSAYRTPNAPVPYGARRVTGRRKRALGQGTPCGLASRQLGVLNDHIALARSILADTGMTVAREDLALEPAFWAQLPGNFPLRPRKAPITSHNFAAMVPFHNYPAGRAAGNHWGDALTLLMTRARSPYYFSLHASDPREPDGGSRKDTGHTFICGPTGSGKTVLIGFLVAMLQRQGATQIIFDKDRGLEILVRAMGGEYLPLRNGRPTGFNPLQLTPFEDHLEFLKGWLRMLVRRAPGQALSAREQADLDQALRGTLALAPRARRLSRLIEFLDPTDPEGVHARLARWCEAGHGDYAWVFDNARDTVVARLDAQALIGFDVTEFLDHELTRAPVTLYLFHLVRRLLDGRRLVCWMDEFWRLLADPAFESFAKDGPKTWRKLNAVMCLATQSASDVLSSPISRTIIEQTPTKVYFPNPNASEVEHLEGFGLSGREHLLIKEGLEPGSRMFLVKQGRHGVVCQLDLKGFDAELAVISGRAGQLEYMQRLIAARGAAPGRWLPAFMATNAAHE